jgi:ERCC4-related helicase
MRLEAANVAYGAAVTQRLRKARRVLAVQTELDRLAEWTLNDFERQERALQDQRRDLMRFLDGESAFTDIFATTLMHRLERLETQGAALFVEKRAEVDRRLEERGRMRRAERIVDALVSEARRKEELRLLAEMIEVAVRRRA